jgi:hypothetical protein
MAPKEAARRVHETDLATLLKFEIGLTSALFPKCGRVRNSILYRGFPLLFGRQK